VRAVRDRGPPSDLLAVRPAAWLHGLDVGRKELFDLVPHRTPPVDPTQLRQLGLIGHQGRDQGVGEKLQHLVGAFGFRLRYVVDNSRNASTVKCPKFSAGWEAGLPMISMGQC
jgi:hypothetical protein